ncbi:MAG: DNA mismatch repair protein MutS [Dysgonamonadaceae bacterium]|jgi:dsDNA-specific endonuclease/ATPase MutS2|nr:DNA mismatch repair protein MutS [Dysgonamonadaceae bacterium]
MLLKNALQKIEGLRFIIDKLDVQSGLTRRLLFDMPSMNQPDQIISEWNQMEVCRRLILRPDSEKILSAVRRQLAEIKDIRGTLERIRQKKVLDDIELFEIKAFSLLSQSIAGMMENALIDIFPIPSLEEVIHWLDPDNTRIPHFYIVDAYSSKLAKIRKQIRRLKQASPDSNQEEVDELYLQTIAIEDEIRQNISLKLGGYVTAIGQALSAIAAIDLSIAKAQQAIDWKFCKPGISEKAIRYTAIFNPEIQMALHSEGKKFQPVDICIEKTTTIITGANMTGKSALLKTIALAQTLFQYGFYLPASEASTICFDEIMLCMGDEQDTLRGLSSFAAEALKINDIAQAVKEGKNILALIDEPARTTNPDEGKAIVNALTAFLAKHRVYSLITTHYSDIKASCKRLRVKGFRKETINERLTIDSINRYIDYSLEEETGDEPPREAVHIMRILDIEPELLELIEEQTKRNQEKTI